MVGIEIRLAALDLDWLYMLIDTHCHLTYSELGDQLAGVLTRATEAGVGRIITIATDPADARDARALAGRFPEQISYAAGIHPHEAAKVGPDELQALNDLHHGRWAADVDGAQMPVAVGETGLDFHYDFAPPARQEEVFRFQLELAMAVGRPVIIHARKAEERVCDILAEYPRLRGRVVFHCFSRGPDVARRIDELGLWLSFTGVVTFDKTGEIPAAAEAFPLDRIMVETDGPFLSPAPVRKVRPNEPAFVAHTARFIAELRGMPFEEFAAATSANARRFFGLT